ncbi:uncharacterized protein LOC131300923 isoform X2 [Rhododendron vialii]|uniref:uncharacterized protein LOC131300923 isoform X2 n=1 Tax=Rhododendron vialii TaxID=182163 RepID=UPI00265E5EBB|nr:uncharacterized protein LOC131300923 isoform X2 [Rhododendron vialii]
MEETTQCGLKIEVIDETAVIETTPVCEDSEGNGVDINNILKQETDGNKEKRNRRRGKGARKFVGTNEQENILIHTAQVQIGFSKKGEDLSCSQVMDDEIVNINPLDPACDLGVGVEEECIEEDDSDEDYSSIQRPAFFVTGEPNFDAGPPQDGLEYLRRVRWEAAHVPKVKVAKLERSKLKKEQTAYMPVIPDIEKCPEHLLPMKQWEDAFMADFSDLRLALSRLEDSRAEISAQYLFSSTIHPEESSNQLPETVIAENFDLLTNGGDESSEALDCSTPESPDYPRPVPSVNENDASPSLENDSSKTSVCGSSSDSPTLSAVLGMDSVARLSSLRRRIRLAENMTTLSRNDCAWLFALCAAIDTPLDADTCAALRCLLRKCASLRAGKLELDDEVVMLNILATITGKYFGQSEL